MADMISREEVDKLADLAKLDLKEAERNQFGEDMGRILDYVDEIQAVEVTDMKVTSENLNVLREDKVTNTPGEFTKEILQEVPETDGELLKIHKILGGSE